MIELGPNRYGKSAIRLVRIVRGAGRHEVRDVTVAISLEGDFEAAHVAGDNSAVVATDTMKNTVYALAGEHLRGPIEAFARALAGHFRAVSQVSVARVSIDEHGWSPIDVRGQAASDAFVRTGLLTRTALVAAGPDTETIEGGLRDLTVMKTTRSGFSGFPRDRYTTLAEVDDRILATRISAVWRYRDPDATADADFDRSFEAVRSTLLETFADHDSPSVQASIWIVGRAVLERHPEIDEIRMTLPNLHHWLVDLTPFGLDNRGEIFVATQEPYGLIEATVRRS